MNTKESVALDYTPVAPAPPAAFVSPEQQYQSPISEGVITETMPPDPASPSIIDRIASIGSAIVSPFVSVGKAVAGVTEEEVSSLITGVTNLLKSSLGSVYDYIANTATSIRTDAGNWVKDAKDAALSAYNDVHNYAAHLFDSLSSTVDALGHSLSNDIKSVDSKIDNGLTTVEGKIGKIAESVTSSIVHPIAGFISDSEGWFKRHWDTYSADLVSFVNNSETWVKSELDKYTADVKDFLDNPTKWFKDNFTTAAGDLIKWLDPVPLSFLKLLPNLVNVFEWLASNPIELVFSIGRALIDKETWQQVDAHLNANKYELASKAVDRWRQSL